MSYFNLAKRLPVRKRRGPKSSKDFENSVEFHKELAEMRKEECEKKDARIEELEAEQKRIMDTHGEERAELNMALNRVKELEAAVKIAEGALEYTENAEVPNGVFANVHERHLRLCELAAEALAELRKVLK